METLLCRRTWPPFPSHPVVVSLCVSSSLSASCTSGVLSCQQPAPGDPGPGCAPSVSWDEWRGWGAGGGLCQARLSLCPSWARHLGETTQPAQSWLRRALQGPDLRPVPLVVVGLLRQLAVQHPSRFCRL
ncbi:unnamed protein product [Rangifer tarandus platyrhynchus]|uniref:Uncharacterized protein n=1 Tax=Rangifer tarandus platyrhynchus TaxID=3082113 RepID=A0AC60A9I2_RANTA